MKNLFKLFAPMTAAVVVLASCAQESFIRDKAPALKITVKATPDEVKADEPGVKSYIDGTAIKWGTGEYMKIGVYDGSATAWGASTDTKANDFNGLAQAYFNFSINPVNVSGSYTYYGFYPASAVVDESPSDAAAVKVIFPAIQNATASSYDPSAYLLIARPDSGHDATNADWTASFRRATALNKLTLSNLPEDIKRVTITVPAEYYLAGRRYFNLTTGESGDLYYGQTNTIDVRYATKLTGGADMNVWFTSWGVSIPENQPVTIVAYSSAHVYSRTISVKAGKTIDFKEGYLNTLSVDMTSATVEANTELEPGNYLVLARVGDAAPYSYFALKAAANGTRIASVNYDGSVASYSGDADMVWTISKSGESYLFENDGKYLGWGTANDAYLCAADSEYKTGELWTADHYVLDVTWDSDCYHVTNHATSARILSRNASSDYWAFYASNQQKNIIFVPATVDPRTPVTLSFTDGINAVTVANYNTGNYQSFGGYDVVSDPDVTAITNNISWSYSGDDNGIIDDLDAGVVELTGNIGSCTITATFDGDENYRPAQASYTINVIAADANDGSLEKPYTASEAAALALGGNTNSYYITGYVTNIPYQFDLAHGTASFWLHDSADGSTQTFEGYGVKYFNNVAWIDGNATLTVGDKVLIYGELKKYNTTPETNGGYLVKVNDKAGLTVPTLTASPDDANKQITVTWGAASGSTGSVSYVINCGTQSHNASAAGHYTFTMADYGTFDVSVIATADNNDAWNSAKKTSSTLTDPDAGDDWSTTYTSNVTIAAGSNSQAAEVVISEENYSAIKAGTSGKAGVATVTVPSGATKLYVHVAGWNGENGKTVNITPAEKISKVNGVTATSLTTVADTGVANNSPFTLAGTSKLSTNYFYEIDLTGITVETTITFTAANASKNRFVIWGCNAE